MMASTFKIGEKVMAKWPSSHLYFKATILNQQQKEIEVQFEDATISSIAPQNVKKMSYFRKSKSKSPSRNRKRSTSRSAKKGQRQPRSRSNSPGVTPVVIYPDREPVKIDFAETIEVKPTIHQRSRARLVDKVKPSRTSARLAAQHPDHTVRTEELLPSSGESDLDTDLAEKKHFKIHWRRLFMKFIIFSLSLLLPIFVLLLNVICNKINNCSLQDKIKIPRNLPYYFSVQAFTVYFCWLTLQIFLTLMPVGKMIDGHILEDGTHLKYRLNGFHSLVVSLLVVISMGYYGTPLNYASKMLIPFILVSTIVSFIFSVYLFVRSRNISPALQSKSISSGSFTLDLFWGRELNPRIGSLDLKLLTSRLGLNGWALIIISHVWENIIAQEKISPNLLLLSILQFFYILHSIWHEENILNGWKIKYDGLGLKLVFENLTLLPYVCSFPLRYLLLYSPQYFVPQLIAILIFQILGYFILICSNNQKSEFKRNPYHPRFTEMKKISTDKSQKILAGGWWGFIRHPNYLGEFLIIASWSLFCGFGHILPYIYLLYLYAVTIYHMSQAEARNHEKYGLSWKEYCQHARFKLIPYVF